jgi:hypothetical protein
MYFIARLIARPFTRNLAGRESYLAAARRADRPATLARDTLWHKSVLNFQGTTVAEQLGLRYFRWKDFDHFEPAFKLK